MTDAAAHSEEQDFWEDWAQARVCRACGCKDGLRLAMAHDLFCEVSILQGRLRRAEAQAERYREALSEIVYSNVPMHLLLDRVRQALERDE